MNQLASIMNAWAKPRHCLVLCETICETDWRTGKFMPTHFTAANDKTLGVGGLWPPWKHPETAQWELSFTMFTMNADDHPHFKHTHRPNPKRPPEMPGKRMVVVRPEAQ